MLTNNPHQLTLTPTSSSSSPNQPSPSISSSTPISSSPSTYAEHGIVKPRKLFNLHTSSQNSIFPLTTNSIDALHDPNRKMVMKDKYDTLIVNNMWGLVSLRLMLMLFKVCGFSSIKRIQMDLSGTKLFL